MKSNDDKRPRSDISPSDVSDAADLSIDAKLLRALVEQSSEAVLVFDRSGRLSISNPATRALFGLEPAALDSSRLEQLFANEHVETGDRLLVELAAGKTLRSVRLVARDRPDGGVRAELAARLVGDDHILVTARDISARDAAERRIRDLAYFDPLTSLPNRELFHEQIERAIERARENCKQIALLFVDMDRFKQVNDSLGHSVGDELLKEAADRLRSAVRGSDSLTRATRVPGERRDGTDSISRLGGDEFTILLQDLEHSQDAARVARRVLHALSRPFVIGGREIFVGASIGIAVWPEDGEDSDALLRSADIAMEHAKNRGGNAYEFFNTGMNSASTRRLMLESRLRRALERDEFHLLYQPIRDSRSGLVSAAEALVRWVDLEGNTIGPDEFIPIAEETGLIGDIGAWVLREACRQSAEWQERGFDPIRISVNIAVGQLRDASVTNMVEEVLFATGLEPTDLELEITESSILDDDPNIISAVSRLTEVGVGFALDDFGTGYSSLSALQRFPIERLKIDRSFVAGVGESASDEALTSAIIALAKSLDQRVVAEGVETEAQAAFLTQLGCDELQGYLFSRPIPPEEFEAFLRTQSKPRVARPEGAG